MWFCFTFWLIGRMQKSICNHELSVIIVIICDQFSYTNTKSKKVSSLHVVHYHTTLHPWKFIFACTRNLNLKLVPLWLACLKTSGCAEFGLLNMEETDFSPKCVFSETDHETALKLVPLQSAWLKTSGCTEFDPLNTKESDDLAQSVFSQKWIIIQLWNLYCAMLQSKLTSACYWSSYQ